MQWVLFWKYPWREFCQSLPCASIKVSFIATFLSHIRMIFFKVSWVKQNMEKNSEVGAGPATLLLKCLHMWQGVHSLFRPEPYPMLIDIPLLIPFYWLNRERRKKGSWQNICSIKTQFKETGAAVIIIQLLKQNHLLQEHPGDAKHNAHVQTLMYSPFSMGLLGSPFSFPSRLWRIILTKCLKGPLFQTQFSSHDWYKSQSLLPA